MKRALAGAALLGLMTLAPSFAHATAPMKRVRWLHTAVKLNDGRVLVAGGFPGGSDTTAEIYDVATDSWADTPTPMLYNHIWHLSATLCDGRVLVAGQFDSGSRKAEVYDPIAGTWTATGNTLYSHIYGAVVPLGAPDCRIALVGGYSGNYWFDLYDPVQNKFKDGGDQMTFERFFHAVTRLQDGRILVTGGGVNAAGTWTTKREVEIYDPVARKVTKVKSMKDARRGHSATLLQDGRVIVAGGTIGGGGNNFGFQVETTEIYDPVTDTWAYGPSLQTPRTLHSAALLPSGAVLLLGGLDASGSATRNVEGYLNGEMVKAPPLEADRFLHAAVLLDDGGVMLTGGVHQASAEIYRTSPLGAACDSGVTCGSGFCVQGLCCDNACAGGCARCDLPGREGTCATPCAGASHVLGCPGGGSTCAPDACLPIGCAPYACDAEAGACRAQCTTVDDCASGYACDANGACVAPPGVTDGEGSCTVEASPREGGYWTWAIALLAALGLGVRRRRHVWGGLPPTPPR